MSCEHDLIQDDLFVMCSYFKPKEDVKTYAISNTTYSSRLCVNFKAI